MNRLFILIAVAISIVSCTKEKTPYRTALLGSKMTSFDPVGLNEYNEITLISQVCARLTSVDESLNIEGDLAESWDISDDRKTYIFKIKGDRHFADGSPVTIDDIKYSLDRAANKKSSLAATWTDEVESVAALPPNRIQLKLAHGNPRMLYKLSHPRFCIMSHAKTFLSLNGTKIPNSSGAYNVADVKGDNILLEANKDFKSTAIEPKISVRFLDQKRAVDEFAAGHLNDLSFYLLQDEEIKRLEPKAKILNSKIFWTWFLFLNPRKSEFNSTQKRASFINLINPERLAQNWKSDLNVSRSIIPEGMRGYSVKPVSLHSSGSGRFDCPAVPLKITVIEGVPFQENLKNALSSELQMATNCKSVVEFLEMGKYMESLERGNSDIYFSAIDTNSTDPLGFYRQFVKQSSENFEKYDDSDFDHTYHQLYDALPEKRSAEDYRHIEDIFYKAGFGLAIGHPNFKFVYSKDVTAVHMNPLGMHLNRWWKVGRE